MPPEGGILGAPQERDLYWTVKAERNYFVSLFSHCWFAMPQLVLQADWQDVWHSPQPPFFAL